MNEIMAKSFLTNKHLVWLFENYADSSNQHLAEELTQMVKSENEEIIKALERLVESEQMKTKRISYKKEIKWRKSFKEITPNCVKKTAYRVFNLSKSTQYIQSTNADKAQKSRIKRLCNKAEIVSEPLVWLKSFKQNEVRLCRIESNGDIRKIRNAISHFNRVFKYEYGIHFFSEIIKGTNLMKVIANKETSNN